jgi:hypothetical protein
MNRQTSICKHLMSSAVCRASVSMTRWAAYPGRVLLDLAI